MNKTVDHTNNRINEKITRLQRVQSFNKSTDKHTCVKVTDNIEINVIFGLMYFRSLLGVNLHLADNYFQRTVTLFLILSCRKLLFIFAKPPLLLQRRRKT